MRSATLYRIVTIIGQQRQYACTDDAGTLLGFTCKPDRAVKMPVEKALRMLRQVRRRMAPNADIEAVS